jgi:hypothetical protein
MSSVELSDEVVREFVAEFGDDAARVAERALRGEITRHRITRAVRAGHDPAAAVADALSKDPEFLAAVDDLAAGGPQAAEDLDERLRRWAV